jgi:hypothetical protein
MNELLSLGFVALCAYMSYNRGKLQGAKETLTYLEEQGIIHITHIKKDKEE